ncbi:MAG: winged helix DNA-binding domain-containing protein [Planctomycetes bacterium]|nr:winged helix DNA-binding domain-containing protein [Planctomycetota bacterium]
MQLDARAVRAARILAQGLPAPRGARLTAQAERSGWQRTIGGAEAYLGLRARAPKLRRGDLEALVAEGEFAVVPAARGCIYLVPRAEAPLALAIAGRLCAARDARDAERAGIRAGELDEVGDAVVAELRAGGPRTTDGLRRTLGDAVRGLGERGKRVGVSSTLPPALRRLEFAGRIARTPVGGRLDHEKYEWRAADRVSTAGAELPEDPVELHARLLTGFVARAGVTTLASFCTWSGLTKRDATAALQHADCVRGAAEGITGEALCSPLLDKLLRRTDQALATVALLPFEDNLVHLTGGVADWVDPAKHDLQVPVWGNMKDKKPTTRLGDSKHVSWRTILADGRICGFWDYDPEEGAVITGIFDPPGKAARRQIDALAQGTSEFLRDEIGHARSFSIDTEADLTRRCGLLRELGAR